MCDTFLLHCPHFCGLPQPTQSKIYALAQHRRLAADELLLTAGERWLTVIWVKSGTLRLFTHDESKDEHNIAFFSDDDFLWPVTESLRNQPSPFNMKTMTPTELWVWSYSDFREQFDGEDEWRSFTLPWIEAIQNTKSRSA
ncbi:Crp/Fnr family transcriptional regulator [Vibrio sp. S9_S30]|uniref:Crp/Fnr family transcriptional regulator n=1 Tax=Vibrio sp. S9_S30 TaxID=2720226 RepID=UPI0016818D60|nr:Crp/Fnr family transcriptional regulator [Vibrio sp. S9_S30]MBD1557158.1 Crp/Fnr family transcriptional regulator [Vibrio sp. S9_S30]